MSPNKTHPSEQPPKDRTIVAKKSIGEADERARWPGDTKSPPDW